MFKTIIVFGMIACAVAVHHGSDTSAQIKSLHTDVKPDGFDYGFETSNSIRSEAHGDEHGNIQGQFEWVDPSGKPVIVKYIANENGYQPSGDLLPTPPPIPEAILKSLEYNRAHPTPEEHVKHIDHHHYDHPHPVVTHPHPVVTHPHPVVTHPQPVVAHPPHVVAHPHHVVAHPPPVGHPHHDPHPHHYDSHHVKHYDYYPYHKY